MKILLGAIACLLLIPIAMALLALWMNQASLAGEPGAMRRLALYLGSNVAVAGAAPSLPELAIPAFRQAPAEVLARVRAVIHELGWEMQETDAEAGRLHAVVSTPLFGFKDDVWVQVHSTGDQYSQLQLRARSRVGKGDFGANRRHLLRLLDALQQPVPRS